MIHGSLDFSSKTNLNKPVLSTNYQFYSPLPDMMTYLSANISHGNKHSMNTLVFSVSHIYQLLFSWNMSAQFYRKKNKGVTLANLNYNLIVDLIWQSLY